MTFKLYVERALDDIIYIYIIILLTSKSHYSLFHLEKESSGDEDSLYLCDIEPSLYFVNQNVHTHIYIYIYMYIYM